MQHKISICHIPCIMHQLWQSLQFCMDFHNLRVVLSSTTNVCSSLFTSIQVRRDCFFIPLSFLCHSTFLLRSQLPPAAYKFLIASHNLQHFQAPVQELVYPHILPSPHYHEFCKHQAKPPKQPQLAHTAWVLSYFLPPVDGQHDQEGQSCRCCVPILQNICKLCSLKNNTAGLHPSNLHGCKLKGGDTQKWYHLAVHLLYTSVQNVEELP